MSEMRCYKSYEILESTGCHDHEDFHHARSMKEIQAAIRAGRQVYDPDGDQVRKARVCPKESAKSPTSRGRFNLGVYDSYSYEYRVSQILVEDEPLDEKAAEAEVMKSLMASLARG